FPRRPESGRPQATRRWRRAARCGTAREDRTASASACAHGYSGRSASNHPRSCHTPSLRSTPWRNCSTGSIPRSGGRSPPRRRRWADRGQNPPALLDRKVRLLAPLLSGHRRAGVQPADVAAEIEWAKARGIGPAHYEAEAAKCGRKPPVTLSVLASLYERYEE